MMDPERLLRRFLSYVAVESTADESTTDYPSSAGQRELGAQLVQELLSMGVLDAHQDQHALVWATLPATPGYELAPVVALNSHLDTSPETTAHQVKPQVIRSYAGGDIALTGPGNRIIQGSENPELDALRGKTIITTDGTTLLGADDKAGLAIIMEIVQHLLEHPEIAHGPVRLLFTCDEEIGRGVMHVDVDQVQAQVGYTFDGSGANTIDVETFSGDLAVVTVEGVNIHPSIAKDRMVNAIRVAARFLSRLPDELSPEHTDARQGFLHPYDMQGGVGRVSARILLRDFQTPRLEEYATLLRRLAAEVESEFPGARIGVDVRLQYRNMGEGLGLEPRAVELARRAHENLGRTCKCTIVRGGTDGSMLTAKGLPTPNLSCGQHNQHSPLEWACLDEMQQAVELGVELLRLWGQEN